MVAEQFLIKVENEIYSTVLQVVVPGTQEAAVRLQGRLRTLPYAKFHLRPGLRSQGTSLPTTQQTLLPGLNDATDTTSTAG